MAAEETIAAELTPSQTINGAGRRNRGRGKKKKPEATEEAAASSAPPTTQKKRAPRKKKKAPQVDSSAQQATDQLGEERKPPAKEETKVVAGAAATKKKNRRKRGQKRYPWQQHIPPDTVDPITLESLHSLHYPPFALVVEEPYDVVEVWPIPESGVAESKAAVADETEEERERRIMEEQWGKTFKLKEEEKEPSPQPTAIAEKRHYHLFDGRALAYYMVSQLQFIDPLNRRDLTRDELVNLDHYLRRHGFTNLNVTEAYDVKGVTISKAGSAGNTAAGRAAILQQEASTLLHALFGGMSVAEPRVASRRGGDLRSQYQSQQESEDLYRTTTRQDSRSLGVEQPDAGVYGGEGLLVIDDDMNPGLRSSAPAFVPGSADSTLWSARHIAQRYGHEATVRAHDFPSLSAVATRTETKQEEPLRAAATAKKPPSKTLARITGAVKKTDPEEQQRQWEAREAARRRAMMSNLTFGSNPAAWDTPQQPQMQIPSTIVAVKDSEPPSEAQLQRNRAFAEALGVRPATVRRPLNSGWARPADGKVELDEFGNELNAAMYPDALIVQARERMGPLLKLEKKWLKFMEDDTAASLPLNRMDRPMRAFVHEYSDFWKLHTESFDPEPNRYIHCVKLLDTRCPQPLLSDAASNWRGPRPVLAGTRPVVAEDHDVQQTAGQSTRGREIPPLPARPPLMLKPRSTDPDGWQESSPGIPIGGFPSLKEGDTVHTRFESMREGRERPKLQLQKRTVPLELPPYEPPPKGFDVAEEMKRRQTKLAETVRREREKLERHRQVLQAAFASDDEASADSSEWSEQEPEFIGSDDEE